MKKLILIKFGELTTKKGNRKIFISLLRKNIKELIKEDIKIISDRVRMYIETDEIDVVVEKLKKVSGIHGITVCYKTTNDVDDIKKIALEVMSESVGKTFKVKVKRADKRFEIRTMEFNDILGGLILRNTDFKVDVKKPDILLNIEIREEGTFVYTNEIRGMGGYPVGVQGKGILMLSGGLDSPVAGYLAMRKGIDVICLYFDSPPHTSVQAKNKVINLTNVLNQYSGRVKLIVVPFTNIQEEIYKKVPISYNITIMRRMMYRIAEKIMKRQKAKVIINGESIGQVASQTLDSMMVINEVVKSPVIRPVSCLDKLEIIDMAQKIKTHDISIEPFEDCCTIFLAKSPIIKPKLEICVEYEKVLEIEKLVEEAVENIEIISEFNKKNELL